MAKASKLGNSGTWRRLAVLVLVMVLIAACAPVNTTESTGGTSDTTTAPSDTTAETTDGSTAPEQTITEGGTIRIAVRADPRYITHEGIDEISALVTGSTTHDALFTPGPTGESLPALATSATRSEDDPLEWTFTLREGVVFHNGKAFTSQDVADNLAWHKDPANASEVANDLGNVESWEVVDDYTIVMRTSQPDLALNSTFTNRMWIGDLDSWEPNSDPIGTGPYSYVSHAVGDRYEYERFEDHWRGRPPLDEVQFIIIPDLEVIALELQQGNIDLVYAYVSPNAIPALQADPNIELYSAPGAAFYNAMFNHEKDRRGGYENAQAVRQGLAHLFNRNSIVPPIVGDFANVANQVLPPWQLGHDPNIAEFAYDTELGMGLLAEGGIEVGDTIELVVRNNPFLCDVATAFQSELNQLGYDATLQCLDPVSADPVMLEFTWDMAFMHASGRANAATMFNARFHSSLADPESEPTYTVMSDEIDEGIEQLGTASSVEEYEQIAQEISRVIVEDIPVTLPLYWQNQLAAARSNVKGVVLSSLTSYGILMNEMTTVYMEGE